MDYERKVTSKWIRDDHPKKAKSQNPKKASENIRKSLTNKYLRLLLPYPRRTSPKSPKSTQAYFVRFLTQKILLT